MRRCFGTFVTRFSSTFQKFKLGQSVAKRKLTSMTHPAADPRDFSRLSYVGPKWDSRTEVPSCCDIWRVCRAECEKQT